MFGLTPKAPVSPEAQQWVEDSFRWFVNQYSRERLQTMPVILPTEEFFPEDFHLTDESIRATFLRICGFMHVRPERVSLEVFEDEQDKLKTVLRASLPHWEDSSQSAAGTYHENLETEQLVIAVKRSKAADPVALIATLAHELSHALLLGEKRLDRDAPDMEPLTDLATVFWGMGIFTANSAARFQQHDDGMKQGWSFQRLGYLSEPMFAYTLAVFAWERGERKPAWAKHLRLNVGTYFRQSLKALQHQDAQRNKPKYSRG